MERLKGVGLLFLGMFFLVVAGCSSETQPTMTQEDVVVMIYEETGEVLYLPEFEQFDVSYVYVQYDDGGNVRSIDVQYADGRTSEVIDYFQDPSNVAEWEKQHHAKKVYGPFEGDVAFMLTYSMNGLTTTATDQVIELEKAEVIIQEDAIFTIHSISLDGGYTLAYNNDYVTEEEALEQTRSFLRNVK